MHFHRGRLVDHVHLRVADLPVSKRFYRAVLESLGRAQGIREGEDFFNSDELWIDQADGLVSRVHLAFQADSLAQVQAFHAAALPLSSSIPTVTSRRCITAQRRSRWSGLS